MASSSLCCLCLKLSSVSNCACQNMYVTYSNKRKERTDDKELISLLPDDILVHVLSLLTDVREAARTSVLSKQWRLMWSYLPDYDFDVYETLPCKNITQGEYDKQIDKFAHCINQAVRSSRAPSINKFKVHLEVGATYNGDILTWVDFAMGKSVQELKLDFSDDIGSIFSNPGMRASLGSLWCYAHSPSVHTLVSLTLASVRISGDFLESLLFTFPNLEHLSMKAVDCKHHNFKVVGSLLKLRDLEILYCEFGELEIFARNLKSIVLRVHKTGDVKFSYVPLLNEATFGGRYSICLMHNLRLISGLSSQLTSLTFRFLSLDAIILKPIEFHHQFGNLKQLVFCFSGHPIECLLVFTKFIHVCPLLRKLKVQRTLCASVGLEELKYTRYRNETGFIAKKHHHCLKIFEMVGFVGSKVDIELVLYLAQFASVLEKVILDPQQRLINDRPSAAVSPVIYINTARKETKLLRNQLPPRVQLELRNF